MLHGGVRGMYMMGENPFLSDPNINKVRKALAALEFLVVQDIFLTETAEFADVVLPATSYLEKDGTYTNTDRRVQLGRKALEPPGQARDDWRIVQQISNRVGLPMDYASPREVFDELVGLMPNYAGLSYDNLGPSGKLYPNPDPEHSDGTVVLFQDRFGTDDGKAHLVPAEWLPARELPDDEYPFVLNTGRLLEHWHTGSMTRRSYALDAIEPEAHVFLHADDAAELGVGRRRLRARDLAARLIELKRADLAPRDARQLLHPLPLPRGGRERADDRRDRSDGQDPRVQVLRGPRRARVMDAHAGRRGARGPLPRPEPDPAADGDPAPPRLAPARGAGRAGARVAAAAVRDRGADLVLPALPHRAARTHAPAVCHDLSCWLQGGDERLAELRERYGDDVDSHAVSCLGRCDVAPAAAVDERPVPWTPSATRWRAGWLPPRRCGRGEQRPNDPYEPDDERYRVLRRMLSGELSAEAVIDVLKESGLRGMGGAGFPTGRKWETVRAQEARPRYAICNADESEPGTFKDRQILAEQPHLVLEGLLLGMLACGAEQGWVFIRHEYGPEEAVIRDELDDCALRAAGRRARGRV